MKWIHGTLSQKVTCEICGSVVKGKDYLKKHIRQVHGVSLEKLARFVKNTQKLMKIISLFIAEREAIRMSHLPDEIRR